MKSMMVAGLMLAGMMAAGQALAQSAEGIQYRVLATSRTSSMERELNAGAEAGFRFQSAMGGETAAGGNEVVAVMMRRPGDRPRVSYRLVATSRTSTMEKELQEASNAGFQYRTQSVFKSAFSGAEVVCILERDADVPAVKYRYKLQATSRTSTLEKELVPAGLAGYELVGLTVAKTALGGNEIVAILRRAE